MAQNGDVVVIDGNWYEVVFVRETVGLMGSKIVEYHVRRVDGVGDMKKVYDYEIDDCQPEEVYE